VVVHSFGDVRGEATNSLDSIRLGTSPSKDFTFQRPRLFMTSGGICCKEWDSSK
jgi:hypothetical protein